MKVIWKLTFINLKVRKYMKVFEGSKITFMNVRSSTNDKVAEVVKAAEADDVDLLVRPGQLGNFRRKVGKPVKELLNTEQVSNLKIIDNLKKLIKVNFISNSVFCDVG